jgi:RimJ/RimL family protein N-acetyltransferase
MNGIYQNEKYLFKSERLGFRSWEPSDIDKMAEINADEQVMEFFPCVASKDQTIQFIERMNRQFEIEGFCYFAVDKLENNELIGFIGLSKQTYNADFTPCTDVGWRIKSSEWNKGLATEGARRCLDYALNTLKIEKVYSIAPRVNTRSEHVMIKIGMRKLYEFEHPLLTHDERLKTCVLYIAELADGSN